MDKSIRKYCYLYWSGNKTWTGIKTKEIILLRVALGVTGQEGYGNKSVGEQTTR